jgi:ribosomal protein S8
MALMNLIKKEGYIYDYKVVPSNLILAGLKPKILLTKYFTSLLIIFIHAPVPGARNKIVLVSKPSRPLFLTHEKIVLMSKKTINNESLYVLNTTQGLVTLNTAVQQQLGGCLLCRIN